MILAQGSLWFKQSPPWDVNRNHKIDRSGKNTQNVRSMHRRWGDGNTNTRSICRRGKRAGGKTLKFKIDRNGNKTNNKPKPWGETTFNEEGSAQTPKLRPGTENDRTAPSSDSARPNKNATTRRTLIRTLCAQCPGVTLGDTRTEGGL